METMKNHCYLLLVVLIILGANSCQKDEFGPPLPGIHLDQSFLFEQVNRLPFGDLPVLPDHWPYNAENVIADPGHEEAVFVFTEPLHISSGPVGDHFNSGSEPVWQSPTVQIKNLSGPANGPYVGASGDQPDCTFPPCTAQIASVTAQLQAAADLQCETIYACIACCNEWGEEEHYLLTVLPVCQSAPEFTDPQSPQP